MALLPPRIFGPLSECSRSVVFQFAIPGATVVLLRTRAGITKDVGKTTANLSTGIVSLFPTEEFAADDLVTAYQFTPTDASLWQPDPVTVQKSSDQFNPPQILTHLYQCSRGFAVGAMRPGTKVEVFDNGQVIAAGEAPDGTAHVRVVHQFGLPFPGTVLKLRQRICPKPPPPGGASEWVVVTPLPPIEPLPVKKVPGGMLPAPSFVSGLYACSRSVKVAGVVPGAEVVLQDTTGAWWATSGPHDATTRTIELPTELVEGREVEIRQEVGDRCEMLPERRRQKVGPPEKLPKLSLFQIDCPTTPTLYASVLKEAATIEFEVTHQGQTNFYRGVASKPMDPVPAPPMPEGSIVRIRQGECELWSDWSEPQTAKALNRPVQKPRIVGTLFQCQNTVPVENIDPLAGTLRIVSDALGEIANTTYFGNQPLIKVAPSLITGHEITVVHEVCGIVQTSDPKTVQPLATAGIGEMVEPMYDGDTSVTVRDVTAGAYLEIWDQDKRLQTGFAPFSVSGKVNVTFVGMAPLAFGQHIHARFWHCAQFGRNEGRRVSLRNPELHAVNPATAAAGGSDMTIECVGAHFRAGAVIVFQGNTWINTTFLSKTQLRGTIPSALVANPGARKVRVRNPFGEMSNEVEIQIIAQPEPPPPLPPPPTELAFSSVALHNCHTGKRSVAIYKRNVTLGQAFQFVQLMEHEYDEWGTCQIDGDALEIDLPDGQVMEIVAVDAGAVGCLPSGADPSTASPMTLACRRDALLLLGKSTGPQLPYAIG